MDRAKLIFNNEISEKNYKKAIKEKNKFLKKFGDDSKENYNLSVKKNSISDKIGIEIIELGEKNDSLTNGVIIGNIRMGFGHYRISMAIASAAKSMGYTPYWFDLNSFEGTTATKIISNLNNLYSMGSRWSQKYRLFNKLYWEPLNSKGFKKLSYNSKDQKVSELFTPIFKNLPKDIPFIATHVWPAQAAIHANMNNVINVIPDNWPMALHLAEGSLHTVQTPSSYLGYKTLKDMKKNESLIPMPEDSIFDVGHYVDHELVSNLEYDTKMRIERLNNNSPLRFLITVGGAGAQSEIIKEILKFMIPLVKKEKVSIFLNIGDHLNIWGKLINDIPELKEISNYYFNRFDEISNFINNTSMNITTGINVFYHEDIFEAVYSTNILMRVSDCLVTKPSELSFYPIPKLFIKRVGGHEAYGAIRSSEIGDGTIECENTESTIQMLKLLLDNNNNILEMLNNNILKVHSIGVYNGAYKVVELATKKSQVK